MTPDSRISADLTEALAPLKGHRLYAAAKRSVLIAYAQQGAFVARAKAQQIVGDFADVTITQELRKSW